MYVCVCKDLSIYSLIGFPTNFQWSRESNNKYVQLASSLSSNVSKNETRVFLYRKWQFVKSRERTNDELTFTRLNSYDFALTTNDYDSWYGDRRVYEIMEALFVSETRDDLNYAYTCLVYCYKRMKLVLEFARGNFRSPLGLGICWEGRRELIFYSDDLPLTLTPFVQLVLYS